MDEAFLRPEDDPKDQPEARVPEDSAFLLQRSANSAEFSGFLGTLSALDRDAIGQFLTVVMLTPGEVLFRQGSSGRDLYLVSRGQLRADHEEAGERVTVGLIGPGEVVGEMAVLDDAPRSVDVVATMDTTLYQLRGSDLARLAREYPHAHIGLINVIIGDVHRRLRRLQRTLRATVGQRRLDQIAKLDSEDASALAASPVLQKLWNRIVGDDP